MDTPSDSGLSSFQSTTDSKSSKRLLLSLSLYEVVALTIYGESRGETIYGQIAVGCVIRNRLHNSAKKSYHDVCLADRQFSCWNEGNPNRGMLLDLAQQLVAGQVVDGIDYKQCFWVAKGIVDWSIKDVVKGGENYLTTDTFTNARPKWAKYPKWDPLVIGKHTFFDV